MTVSTSGIQSRVGFGHIHIHDAHWNMFGDATGHVSMTVPDADALHVRFIQSVEPAFDPADPQADILTIGYGPDGMFSKLDGSTRSTPPPEHRRFSQHLAALLLLFQDQLDWLHPLEETPAPEACRGEGPNSVTVARSCHAWATGMIGFLLGRVLG
ncbi:MAG: hypothetical protein KC475_02065 [Cyanobacteria bacterium HKST-UBA03]|nr:hypothetical protein [Cyanobacteria bacterium HKST-UBA03]